MLAAILLPAFACASEREPFIAWLTDLREEAEQRGVSEYTFNRAMHGVEPLKRVIELDRRQPESTLSLEEYLDKTVEPRIDEARALYAENLLLLREISQKYGVQPEYIVALWGMESNFGEQTGGFSVVQALATLAYDGRRSAYFRGELLDALTILEQGHIAPDDMLGSWAGAMGQCQFMPKSFLRYAVDYNGDGHKDIWDTKADVFASIANYLSSEGWRAGAEVGSRKHPGANYKVVLRWNRSHHFATAVGALARNIKEE